MKALRSWLAPAAPAASRSSALSDRASSPKRGFLHCILRGRITKATRTKATSLPKSSKEEVIAEARKRDDKGKGKEKEVIMTETLERTIPVRIKKEDEDGHDIEDSEVHSALGLRVASAAHPASPNTTPEPTSVAQESNNEDRAHDDANADSDVKPDWRFEQIYLNIILNGRNEYTLMPSTWKMHFRGIPLPNSLFYIRTEAKSIRPKIYARADKLEYRGALALRKLIEVQGRIRDYRESEIAIQRGKNTTEKEKNELMNGTTAAMAKQLKRGLEQALDWAKKDGSIDLYGDQLPPNVKIMVLSNKQLTSQSEYEVIVQAKMRRLAQEWRSHASHDSQTSNDQSNANMPVRPPVIFGFIIMKHIITIVTMDASDPEAVIHVPCQLHMAEGLQQSWNALAVLVTVCWARDVLLEYIDACPDLRQVKEEESSDPDA